jgi:hypothetical protein
MRREASRRGPGDGALFYGSDRDRWIGRVTIDGERRTVSAKTKTEARKELDLLRRTADDGLPLPEGSMTVSDLLTAWTDKALPNRELADSAITSHKWAIKIRSTLSQALKWAQRRNLVARNIATLVEIPAAAAKPKSGKSLTVAEAKLLLAAAAGTDLEAMWVAMLYLGVRPGEAP